MLKYDNRVIMTYSINIEILLYHYLAITLATYIKSTW